MSQAVWAERASWTATDALGRWAMVGAGVVLLGLSAAVRVYLPGYPVPMTLQTLGVLLLSGLLDPRLGTASVALYLALGASGAPLFAAAAGPEALVQPSAGYLLGFLAVPAVVGLLAGERRTVARLTLAYGAAAALVLACGAAGLALFLGLTPGQAVALGVLPFVPVEAAKIALAVLLTRVGRPNRLRA